jgi:hypothetical protein
MNLRLLPTLGVVLGAFGCASSGAGSAVTDKDVANLTRRTAEANAALVNGDINGYLALIEHAKDYTLMAPFGGAPTRGFDTSSEHRAAMARVFKSAGYQSRTGRCASPRSFAVTGPNGDSCIGMLIRS